MKLLARHTAVYDKVVETIRKLSALYSTQFPVPEIKFTVRGTAAGWADLDNGFINFNDKLLSRNEQTFIDEIVPHEVCHMICSLVHPEMTDYHGPEWQEMMRRLGVEPNALHKYDVNDIIRKTKKFACVNCGKVFNLPPDKWKAWEKGQNFTHKPCKARIVPVE